MLIFSISGSSIKAFLSWLRGGSLTVLNEVKHSASIKVLGPDVEQPKIGDASGCFIVTLNAFNA